MGFKGTSRKRYKFFHNHCIDKFCVIFYLGNPDLIKTHFASYVARRFSDFLDSKSFSEFIGGKGHLSDFTVGQKRNMEFLGGKRSMEFLGGKKRNMEFLGGKRSMEFVGGKRNMEFLGGKKRNMEFLGGKKRFSEFLGGKKRFSEFLGGKRSGKLVNANTRDFDFLNGE